MGFDRRFLICLAVFFTGCAHAETPEGRVILQASSLMTSAFDAVGRQQAEKPAALLTRLNPCACDEQLKYEVQLYDNWRYVSIDGTPEALANLEARAKAAQNDGVFEYVYEIGNSLYTSSTGQKYYKLTVQ